MDYRLAFWVLLTGIVVYACGKTTVYIGTDEEKYNKADIGILLRK